MTEIQKLSVLCKYLKQLFPKGSYGLMHKNDFEMFVAIVLAAQTNDKVTNQVLQKFPYKSFEELANANVEDVTRYIRRVGYYKQKAKLLIQGSKYIAEKFNSELPCDLKKLLSIPGIGRKSAAYILWKKCSKPYIVIDTHMIRVIHRFLGVKLTERNVHNYEREWPKSIILCLNNTVVEFGRTICTAKNPKCSKCGVEYLCNFRR